MFRHLTFVNYAEKVCFELILSCTGSALLFKAISQMNGIIERHIVFFGAFILLGVLFSFSQFKTTIFFHYMCNKLYSIFHREMLNVRKRKAFYRSLIDIGGNTRKWHHIRSEYHGQGLWNYELIPVFKTKNYSLLRRGRQSEIVQLIKNNNQEPSRLKPHPEIPCYCVFTKQMKKGEKV